MKKEAEKLYLVDSIFFNSFRPFQNCIHTKRHISDTSPSNIPTLWYEVWKARKLDFFGVEEKERWMCRYEASRPALSRDLACGHPPAQQNPSLEHSSQDRSTKLSKQKRFCVLHVNGALDEISSEDEWRSCIIFPSKRICPSQPLAEPGVAHYTSIGAKRWPSNDDILSLYLILFLPNHWNKFAFGAGGAPQISDGGT